MKVISGTSIVAASVIALCLSSCLVTSRNPLGNRDQAKRDERLLGVWYYKVEEPKRIDYVAFLPLEGNRLRMMRISSHDRTLEFHGFVSQIGDQDYLNLVCLQPLLGNFRLADPASYLFVHYRINKDNELELSLFGESFFKKALKAGAIKGRLILDGSADYVELTDSTESLADFVEKNIDQDYLEDPLVLKKMKK